ncbi:putative Ccc1 family protein [Helianthus annuus]|nr:putative Ccc1 family protein [Helianthus annuus]
MATKKIVFSITNPKERFDPKQCKSSPEDTIYSQGGQWLRAAVMGANDGLVSVASLMIGVGAVKQDVNAMILSGFAGLVAGACSMAIGEFVSVYSQLDIEVIKIKRNNNMVENQEEKGTEQLPNPMQAALTSALAFSIGAIIPLLSASFIGDHNAGLGVVVAAVTLVLVIFGWMGSVLGGTPVVKSCVRILLGSLIAMAIAF